MPGALHTCPTFFRSGCGVNGCHTCVQGITPRLNVITAGRGVIVLYCLRQLVSPQRRYCGRFPHRKKSDTLLGDKRKSTRQPSLRLIEDLKSRASRPLLKQISTRKTQATVEGFCTHYDVIRVKTPRAHATVLTRPPPPSSINPRKLIRSIGKRNSMYTVMTTSSKGLQVNTMWQRSRVEKERPHWSQLQQQ